MLDYPYLLTPDNEGFEYKYKYIINIKKRIRYGHIFRTRTV